MKVSGHLATLSALILASGFAAESSFAVVVSPLVGEYGQLATSAYAKVAVDEWPNQQVVEQGDMDELQALSQQSVESSAMVSGWAMDADAASWASWSLLKAKATTSNPDPNHTRTDYPQDEAYARARFMDRLLVSGGTGTGSATLSAHFAGDFTGSTPFGHAGASLQVSVDDGSNPTQWVIDFSRSAWSGDTFSETLTGSFQFTYDTPFSLSGELVTSALSGGRSDAYGTATILSIDIDNPDATWEIGSVVNGQMGEDPYHVSAVPEAEVWGMLLAGLGVLGLRRRDA